MGRLELTIIGNQGPYPGPGGACSGYLVRSQGATVLIDCGPGVMPRLQQHIDVSSLDAVVISHFHPDHYSDFLTMRYAFQY
ncbi:MAG: MBL fold metallo-hydrolase, partial [Bacillota bacterium]